MSTKPEFHRNSGFPLYLKTFNFSSPSRLAWREKEKKEKWLCHFSLTLVLSAGKDPHWMVRGMKKRKNLFGRFISLRRKVCDHQSARPSFLFFHFQVAKPLGLAVFLRRRT